MGKMCKIDIHADDYCLSPQTSEDILICIREGKLDSISVMTNMSCYESCALELLKEKNKVKKSLKLSVQDRKSVV